MKTKKPIYRYIEGKHSHAQIEAIDGTITMKLRVRGNVSCSRFTAENAILVGRALMESGQALLDQSQHMETE